MRSTVDYLYLVCVNPHQRRIAAIVDKLLEWYPKNARSLPWRQTRSPYAIWVSEIMLQQTQVKTVIPYWTRWMRQLPDIPSMASASSEKIHKLWEGLGYYTRVRNLQKAAQQILELHDGGFPTDFNEVLALPGIGRYTAGAVCSIAFNQPAPILDGNVIRVLTRVFGIAGNPRENKTNTHLWNLADQLVRQAAVIDPRSDNSCSHFNQSLMELGALICTPTRPDCPKCPLKKKCYAYQHGQVRKFPRLSKRASATARRFAAFVIESNNHYWIQQRPPQALNAHLWEFPNVEMRGPNPDPARMARELFGGAVVKIEPFHSVRHSITRYRIHLEAFRVVGNTQRFTGLKEASCRSLDQMKKLPFTSAHGKILARLPA